MNINKHCEYCKITEEEIAQINPFTKRNRGKKLELDRKNPLVSYDQLENLVFACYWCNNAKTDTFTYTEFLEIGKAFSFAWKNRTRDGKVKGTQ